MSGAARKRKQLQWYEAKALLHESGEGLKDAASSKFEIVRFQIDVQGAAFHNMRETIHGGRRNVVPGWYWSLWRRNPKNGARTALMMSNTHSELDDAIPFVTQASGNVLVAGLGLGVVAEALARSPLVQSVTVVEIEEQVVRLVGPRLVQLAEAAKILPVKIVCQDIHKWRPPRLVGYDAVYLDIWDNICGDDDKERRALLRRFRRKSPLVEAWADGMAR